MAPLSLGQYESGLALWVIGVHLPKRVCRIPQLQAPWSSVSLSGY